MMEAKESLVQFIALIKERTPMYLGGRTITHLKAFLDGWFYGNEKNIHDAHLIEEFQLWIAQKYKVNSTQSWAQIITFFSSDEYKALENFFLLFEEFLAQEKGIKNSR